MPAPERLTRAVLVVSLMLATGTPLVWELTTPPASAGMVPAVNATATSRPATVAATGREPSALGSGVPARRPADAAATIAARPARIDDVDTRPSAAPERLRIPSIGVDAPVVAIGVEDTGEMEVPADVRDVGWYRHGPAPGEPGATVVAGHVDSRSQGRGAFFDLRSLDVGAGVEVTDSAGDVQRFEVIARRTYDKSVLPTSKLFVREGSPKLVLITCGGDFDSDARSYTQNVVIYAQPV